MRSAIDPPRARQALPSANICAICGRILVASGLRQIIHLSSQSSDDERTGIALTRELGSGASAWHRRAMGTITIPLPDEDFAFLREYSAAQGISAEAFLARQARNLREHLQRPLQPEVLRATGIIAPEVAGEEAHRAHVEKKHA